MDSNKEHVETLNEVYGKKEKKKEEVKEKIRPIVRIIKTKRNEPCWCGSEKKYKRCCLEKDSWTSSMYKRKEI